MASNTTVFITGGNTGLGLETVKALTEDPISRNILIGSRSTSKGEEAKAQVQKQFPQTKSTIEVVEIDVLSDESIERAVKYITSKYGKLDTLVNNAGANFDRTMQSSYYVNHRILKKDGVKVIAMSPGFLATGLVRIGADTLKKIGAGDPASGGQFVKDVMIGKRDADEGKVVRSYGIQPW